MRRLCLLMLPAVLLLAGCGSDDSNDDSSASSASTGTEESSTTATSPSTAVGSEGTAGEPDDDEAFCAELETLVDINPEVAPAQDDLDLVTTAAEAAPAEYADDLTAVVAFGELSAGFAASGTIPDDADAVEAAAVEGATNLAAYASGTCGFDVPLFDNVSAG